MAKRNSKHITMHAGNSSEVINLNLKYCSTFTSKFLGLMFLPKLEKFEGLVLDEYRDSRFTTTIHMLFMRFPIAVFWINSNMKLVSKTIALPWRLAYSPSEPARYVVEAHIDMLDNFHVGDTIVFDET